MSSLEKHFRFAVLGSFALASYLLVGVTGAGAALVAPSDDTILTNRGGGPYTIGFDFVVDAPVVINSLGVEDSLGDGLVAASEAGLWDVTADPSVLLGSVTIPAGIDAPLVDGFRYVSIGEEITDGCRKLSCFASPDDDEAGASCGPGKLAINPVA